MSVGILTTPVAGVGVMAPLYAIRNSEKQYDRHDALYADLQEAKKLAHVISLYTGSVISVVEVATDEMSSSFLRGNELLVLPAQPGTDWTPSISEDAAHLVGRKFWENLSYCSKKMNKLLMKRQSSLVDMQEIENLQAYLDDVLCALQIELDDTVYAALYHRWIEAFKYQNRAVSCPPVLQYSEQQIRRKVRQGHIRTGEVAYTRGWSAGPATKKLE